MTACLSQIYRHPIKRYGREALASVSLDRVAECLPMDRHWAVAHDAARLEPGWNACVNFARGAKAPALMSQLDAASGTVIAGGPVALGDAWSLQ